MTAPATLRRPALVWISGILLTLCAARALADGLPPNAPARGLPDYWAESRFLVDSPGASGSLGAGFYNPAAWSSRRAGGLFVAWQDSAEGGRGDALGVLSLRGLTFGMRSFARSEAPGCGGRWSEYTVGLGGGGRAGGFGVSCAWSRNQRGESVRHPRLAVGMIRRWRPVSYGLSSLWDLQRNDYQVQADLGVRPIGPRVTLFAEAVVGKGQDLDEIGYGYGCEVHPLRGLALGVKALDSGEVGVRLRLGLGDLYPDARVHLDNDGERIATTYAIETDLAAPGVGIGSRGTRYPRMELKGPLVYQRYRYFDRRRTLLGTLRQIDACAGDPKVGGLVLNLSGIQASPATLWELRQQLAGFRAQGKKVIVYFDRLGLAGYALASVADQIWMDPMGDLEIPGLALGRTYLRGMLDKAGVGVDELRFFTYKSAFEGFSRTSMSEADREQLDALTGDLYDEVAGLVTGSRGLSREDWDRLVDEKGSLLPREAREAGLVDSLGTFEKAKKAAPRAARRSTPDAGAAHLTGLMGDPVWTPMEWGEPDRIAVLYAIGPCDMDSGIKGRELSQKLKAAADDPAVKAIVLRADSPGGDALPSDLVSREMKQAAQKKPVIVSQGQVAGSGGYWISMYGDSIVASPFTITGSVGVISGWLWDNGLGDKLGITHDHVQRGAHADLGQGMVLPLVNQVVPERPLRPEERARMEEQIRELYADFVKKVAEGRGLTETQVDQVGQGRVWSGVRGRQNGLVDELGGLWRSLEIAKDAAGIPASRAITITEGPGLGAFNLQLPVPRLFGLRAGGGASAPEAADRHGDLLLRNVLALETVLGAPLALRGYERAYLEFLLREPGRPLLLMEPLRGAGGFEP